MCLWVTTSVLLSSKKNKPAKRNKNMLFFYWRLSQSNPSAHPSTSSLPIQCTLCNILALACCGLLMSTVSAFETNFPLLFPLLMEETLHQLISRIYHYLHAFILSGGSLGFLNHQQYLHSGDACKVFYINITSPSFPLSSQRFHLATRPRTVLQALSPQKPALKTKKHFSIKTDVP